MATQLRSALHTSVDSRSLYNAPDRNPDPEPVRLVTRLHVGGSRARVAAWRIVAVLVDGRRRVVCVGSTPGEARAAAREAARNRELPPHRVGLQMQRWVGSPTAGRWEEEGETR